MCSSLHVIFDVDATTQVPDHCEGANTLIAINTFNSVTNMKGT